MIGLIVLQIVLIALNAIFACTEIAVLSINETKLERILNSSEKPVKKSEFYNTQKSEDHL